MRELSLKNCRLDKRYDVQEQLGRGSYAEIYCARDILSSPQSAHNTVVIKALNVFLQNDLDPDLERTLVENFQNEAIALDRVRHPNIISRLGHGTARDLHGTVFHYLVLEYLPGGDLQAICRERNTPFKKALNYIEQVCAGLRHAHRHNVIHRDIKPHNLLLTRDLETVKIADFGVARINQSDSPITRVGTNIYAPPEHSPMLSGGEDDGLRFYGLTFAADIYSLAKSMYTLLTCESPRYFANQPIEALPAACRGEAWADEFLRVAKKATQSDPSARHQTVDEFWEDLAGVREIATDGEITTLVGAKASAIPQAHVARGYSPLAPVKPHFDTSRDLRLKNPLIAGGAPSVSTRDPAIPTGLPRPQPIERVEDYWPQPEKEDPATIFVEPDIAYSDTVGGRKRRRRIRLAVFMVLILGFGGALYGTGAYLRGAGAWPTIGNLFRSQTAVANTDIYLRPEPNTNNDPIGLVTKNSKVRIVNSQNNWYQVDVIQQGRDKPAGPSATRGWLNGKYIDIDGD